MSTFGAGWESITLNDQGAIQQIQFVEAGFITGMQISIGFMGADQGAGEANVLYWIARIRAANWATYLIDPTKRRQINLPKHPAVGNVNFLGPVVGGGAGDAGMLFADCLKDNLPFAPDWCGFIPFQQVTPAGVIVPGVDVQVGDGLILHHDHMGKGPVDSEFQVTVH